MQVKDVSSGTWTSSVIGPYAGGYGTAITMGDGYVFLAIDEQIHTIPIDFSMPWNLAYTYPAGTKVNVLFYDDLLVGTGTGLYAHDLDLSTVDIQQEVLHDIAVYPNPADQFVYFSKSTPVTVYSLAGQLIYSSKEPIDRLFTDNWKAGIYVLVLNNNDYRKLMIVR